MILTYSRLLKLVVANILAKAGARQVLKLSLVKS